MAVQIDDLAAIRPHSADEAGVAVRWVYFFLVNVSR